MFIAVGDDEWANPHPAEARHDLDYEAATLYNNVRRSDAVAAQFRVLDGGHDWDVWRPAFVAGLTELSSTLNATPPTGIPGPPLGTPGTDWAGGVTADGTVAYAASGAVDGQAYAGGLDAVVQAPQWTRQFGTPANDRLYGAVSTPDGGVIVAGYTRGDLDGRHPASPADDEFVARVLTTAYTSDGAQRWRTVSGGRGDDAGAEVVALPGGAAAVVGFTGSTFGVPAGGADVFALRLDARGREQSVVQAGTARDDGADEFGEENLYAVRSGDRLLVTGLTGGDVFLTEVTP
jgi:hypothetical protein